MKKRQLDAHQVTEKAVLQFMTAIETLEKANAIIETQIKELGELVHSDLEEIKNLEQRVAKATDDITLKNDLRNMNIRRIEDIKSLVGGIC